MVSVLQPRRLAGIRFEHRIPEAPQRLPRMDIAVFVGFAAAGPLHTPVPMESTSRFEDVFGGDLPLARDPVTGLDRQAYLAPSVRAFFVNGGRRCWVIRVADEVRAERTQLPLPGILRVADSGRVTPAFGVARSLGAFFDDLELRASLATKSVQISAVSGFDSGSGPDDLSVRFGGSGLRDVVDGDLLRLRSRRPGLDGWVGYVPLERRLSPDVAAFRYRQCRWFMVLSEPSPSAPLDVEATWIDRFGLIPNIAKDRAERTHSGRVVAWPAHGVSGARPTLVVDLDGGDDPQLLIGRWLSLAYAGRSFLMLVRAASELADEGSRRARVEGDAWWGDGAPEPELFADPSAWLADIVAIDVRARHRNLARSERAAGSSPVQLLSLGLTSRHPRAWTKLPTDEEHFGTRDQPLTLAEQARASRAEVDAPRFPLAGGEPTESEDWFVPLGLDTLGVTTGAWHSEGSRIARDGLEQLGPELFLNEELAGSSLEALASEVDFIRFGLGGGARSPLRGLHAAWPIEEASMIAVPDMVHRAWRRDLAPIAGAAPAESPRPTDERTFVECSLRRPAVPTELRATEPDASGTFTLTWKHGGEPGLYFFLEEARTTSWDDARTIWSGPAQGEGRAMKHVLLGRAPGHYDYRVVAVAPFSEAPGSCAKSLQDAARAWWRAYGRSGSTSAKTPCDFTGFERSDGSSTVHVYVPLATDYAELSPREYDATTWLAVSRALVRSCAARGDCVALLALPGHALADEALAREADLLAASGPALAVGSDGLSLPLGARESDAWSYAVLYHPWVTASEEGSSPRNVPPLGALAGSLARRAFEEGAWAAPANQALQQVLALSPSIPIDRRQEFLDHHVNLLRSSPTGFLVLSQDTLAFDPEVRDAPFRPLNVRRLMILLRRLVLRIGEPFAFEPSGENLRLRIRHTFESVLARLQERGAFAGRTALESYRVECGDDLNPPHGVEAGRLIVEIRVAPSRPLTFLTLRLVQVGDRNRVVEIV